MTPEYLAQFATVFVAIHAALSSIPDVKGAVQVSVLATCGLFLLLSGGDKKPEPPKETPQTQVAELKSPPG